MRALRGCYWQTVPPQWGGGRLFGASAIFFYENGFNSEMKNQKSIRRCQNDCLNEGYKRAMAKSGFWAPRPQTKRNRNHFLANTRQSCAKKKVYFCHINISL